jgi:hypothetical protein
VVDLFPGTGSDVGSEFIQIAAVSLNGVDRGITLAQGLQKLRDGFINGGFQFDSVEIISCAMSSPNIRERKYRLSVSGSQLSAG